MIEREWRVHIGPPRDYVLNVLFALGEPVQFPAKRRLTQDYNSADDNVIILSSVVGLASSGSFCLQSGELLAWLRYDGVDVAMSRLQNVEMLRGDEGVYSDETRFEQWVDISSRVTKPVTFHAWEEGNIYDWKADLEGELYNSLLMPPDATVLIETRVYTPSDLNPPWRLAAKGHVRTWETIGDHEGIARWTAPVQSVRTHIQSKKIKSQQFGRSNLAKNANVTASGTLRNAILEPQEFAGGLGNVDPSNVVDEVLGSLWISDAYPSLEAEPLSEVGEGQLVIDEVMVHGPPGSPAELQYVVIRLPKHMSDWHEGEDGGKDVGSYGLCNTDTIYYDVPWNEHKTMEHNYIRLPKDIKLNSKEPLLVLARDPRIYSEHFAGTVHDWRDLEGFGGGRPGADFWLHDADQLKLRYTMPGTSFEPVVDSVKWIHDANRPDIVALPPPGHSMRRYPPGQDTGGAADWIHEEHPAPANDRAYRNDQVWISIELPPFNIQLSDPISDVSPAAEQWLYITDTYPLPSSGTIQLDTEQINYSQKNIKRQALLVSQRGANATVPALHGEQATIKLVEYGEAHTRQAISSIEIHRQLVLDSNHAPIVPRLMFLWASSVNSPKYPGESNYRDDWIGGNSIRQLSNESALVVSADLNGERYKHLMLRIDEMSDGGRAKINDIYVWGMAREATNGERGAGQVVRELLESVLDANEITIDEFTFKNTTPDMQINEGELGGVIEEILKRAGAVMRYEYDGSITISRHPSHPLAPRPEIAQIFETTDIRSPTQVTRPSRIASSQIIVEAFNAQGHYAEGRFPRVGGGDANRVQFETDTPTEEIASQYAQMIYLQQEGINQRYVCKLVGTADHLHAGDRIWLRDVSDKAKEKYFQGRVTAITHGGEKGNTKLEAIEWRML